MDRQRKVSLEWRVFLSIALISFLTYLIGILIVYTLVGGLFSQINSNIMNISILGIISIGAVSIVGYILSTRIIIPDLERKAIRSETNNYFDPPMRKEVGAEIQNLPDFFNRMIHDLQQRFTLLDNLRMRYEDMIENSGEMIHQVDRDLRFVYANKTELKRLGYTLEEMRGMTLADIVPPGEREIILNYVRRVAKEGEGIVETRFMTKSGELIDVEIKGTALYDLDKDSFICTRAFVRDITVRKKLEEHLRNYTKELEEKIAERTKELKDSEERYRSLWDNAEDTMFRVDLDKKIVAVNMREEEILGYPHSDLLGKEIYCLLPIECHNIFDQIFKETLKGEKAPTTEIQVVTSAKGILTVELDMRSISKGNKISFAQIHLRDVTGRKKLEQQLMKAEKMAVLSRFSATLAHDLRNPIIGIKKTLEMLQQFPASLNGDTSKKVFADLITSSDLLLGMINDVLDLYQDSYKELPLLLFHFFMAETLEEVIKLLRFQADEKKVRIELDGAKDLAMRGDKRRLQRVFINILDNAIKFSPSGGKIKITYRPIRCENLTHLYFEVIDEGPGIRSEDLPKIFEPFFTGEAMKSFKKGAGLGLYFCKVIIEAHHGKIWAENRDNCGAAFCINLPIEEEGVANVTKN